MANKDSLLQVKITDKQKKQIEAAAKAQDVKVSQYVLEALDFYSTFDVHFLEHIYSTAQKVKLPMPLVIQSLLQAYIADEAAKLDVHGIPPKIFKRAFQFDQDGLITGNRLSDLVYEQSKADAEKLREKSERLTKEESVILAARP